MWHYDFFSRSFLCHSLLLMMVLLLLFHFSLGRGFISLVEQCCRSFRYHYMVMHLLLCTLLFNVIGIPSHPHQVNEKWTQLHLTAYATGRLFKTLRYVGNFLRFNLVEQCKLTLQAKAKSHCYSARFHVLYTYNFSTHIFLLHNFFPSMVYNL